MFKRQWSKASDKPVKGGSAFVLGCLATVLATVLTYPLQMVQAQARHGNHQGGVLEIGSEIIYQQGVAGLYRGMDSKLLQSVTAAGFMFMNYESIVNMVHTTMGLKTATTTTKLS